jgi:hypothetical protein
MDKCCRRCKAFKAFPEQFRTKQICLACTPDADPAYFTWLAERAQVQKTMGVILDGVPKGERTWYRTLYRNYGVTPQQYRKMLSDQEGVCAICFQTNPGGDRLAVDHDHATGEVRGLLCHNCNIGLGNFHDDHQALQRAVEYLRR